eukprot:COSAG06_NODE_576_length_14051_cov_5.354644_7_plen_209_part_00
MEYLQTWEAMEGFVASGKVRGIGVSNFTQENLQHLIGVRLDSTVCHLHGSDCVRGGYRLTLVSWVRQQASKTVPAVNQVELHPYLSQPSLVQYCEGCGIRVMGYSPLGGSSDRAPEAHGTTLLEHPTVNAIAQDVHKTPGQVLIRWALQRGVISIPKSSNPERLAQNFATLDWDLPEEAMEQLTGLESDFRCEESLQYLQALLLPHGR